MYYVKPNCLEFDVALLENYCIEYFIGIDLFYNVAASLYLDYA